MSGKISVIMPAYNAESFLARSVGSVLGQSYRDLELIVVNDGSKDRTAAVLEEFARQDERLKVLTVENGGPAMARNRGMEASDPESEYFMFLDSDDELLPDAAEYLMGGAATGADMVFMGFTIVNADGSRRDYCEPEKVFSQPELGEQLADLYKANLLNQVWAKLYRAERIRENHIRFPDYRWGEDRLFIFDCLEKAERFCVLPACKHLYIMQQGESLISRFYDKKFEVCLEVDRRMEALCARCGVKDESVFRYMFAKSIFSCMTTLSAASCPLSGDEKAQFIRRILRDERVKRRTQDPAGGLPVKLLCSLMHTGSVGLNRLSFRAVSAAGKLAPALFMKVKHRK